MAARRRLVALVLLGVACVALIAPAVGLAAQPPTFEPGRLTSAFPRPVTWSFAFHSDVTPRRIELLTELEGSDLVFVSIPPATEVTQPRTGSWLVSGQDLEPVTPNTEYRARLRVTTADGVFLGPEAKVLVADTRFDWQVRESDRLRLHWYNGGADFGARALSLGDAGVAKAETFLGLHLPTKVDVFVYADDVPFRDAIGPRRPENVVGVPIPTTATLFALIRPEQIDSSFVGEVIPHELTHLVLGAGIGPGVQVPLWLNEGFAVYLSRGETNSDRQAVRDAIAGGTLVPLDGLAGDFPTLGQGQRSLTAYSEAVSAVAFMDRTFGQARVAALVADFTSKGPDDAFRDALGVDTAAFNAAWLHSIGAPAPPTFGPQPAPSGPLPSDWLGPAPIAGLLPVASATPGAPAASPESPGTPATPGTAPGERPGTSAVGIVLLVVTALLVIVAVGAALVRRRRAR